ncbi:MAG: hypothetical protein EON60_13185 [Alphaproteobacteria bacterium]|nr:MAG: hypothetical protein EON60_13185 [Alphaproteobacteria bacterium]
MCDDCKHKHTCAAIGVPPSVTPRKEACFESEVQFSLMEAMRGATLAPPATRFASNNESTVRVY